MQVGRKNLFLTLNAEPAVLNSLYVADQTKVLTEVDEFLQRGLVVGLLQLSERLECRGCVHDGSVA